MRINKVKFLSDKEIKDSINAKEYNKVINNFLPLVIMIANKMKRPYDDLQDIISVGYSGLSVGIHTIKCDDRSVVNYVRKCITNEILKYFESEAKHSNTISYDYYLFDNEEDTLFDFISDDSIDLDENIMNEEIKFVVNDILGCLSDNNRYIIERRYGINREKMTQDALANELNIKRSTLAMKEKRILDILKREVLKKHKDFAIR